MNHQVIGIGSILPFLLSACTDHEDLADDAAFSHVDAHRSFSVHQGTLYHSGRPLNLYGINWFGAETSSCRVGGLSDGSLQQQIGMMKALGFNAVRIPLCHGTLQGVWPQETGSETDATEAFLGYIDPELNPQLIGLDSLGVLDAVIDELGAQDLFAVLDYHKYVCDSDVENPPLWYPDDTSYTEQDWLNDLSFIAHHFKNDSHVIGIDLKNEPHDPATWGTGNEDTDWNLAAEMAAQAIHSFDESLIVFVEGIQDPEEGDCFDEDLSYTWGENLGPMNCYPLNIASDRLVLSPHSYERSWYAEEQERAFNFWDTAYGNLVGAYAVIPGEFGGPFEESPAWEQTYVDYLIDKEICSSFYWAWNGNTSDGGLVTEEDWTVVNGPRYLNLCRLRESCDPSFSCEEVLENSGIVFSLF